MKLPCFPSFDNFCSRSQNQPRATHAQVSCSLDFDCLHPIAVLEALQQQEHFFLLESATAEKNISRYSFLGYQIEGRFRCLAKSDGTAQLWEKTYRNKSLQSSATSQYSQDINERERLLNKLEQSNPFLLLFQNSIDRPEPLRIIPLPRTSSVQDPKWEGFQGGLVGMFSYEAVRHMGVLRQNLRQLSTADSTYGQQPEMLFYEVHRFFVIDNASQRIFAVYLAPLDQQDLAASYRNAEWVLESMADDLQEKLAAVNVGQVLPSMDIPEQSLAAELSQQVWQEDQTEEQQRAAIESLRRELIAGEGLQVVFSVGREGPTLPPALFYRLLRRQNPSPYMFFFKDGQQHLVGSSPETHLRYQNGLACIKPLAGTRPLRQNLSDQELQQIIDDLLADPKERAEHLMLIDLARNDLYTNCQADSVKTVKKFCPEVYSHVVHIVSEVHGHLRAECKPYELFAKTFPAGTLSGAPKVRAMELIDQYEQSPRGFYGGCMGYFNYDGSFDTAIVIRSVWIDSQRTLARSGSGLVYDSKAGYEILEHRQKLGILSRVLQGILQADLENR